MEPAMWCEMPVDSTPGHGVSRAVLYLLSDGSYVPVLNVTVTGIQFRSPTTGDWLTVIDTTSAKMLIEADTVPELPMVDPPAVAGGSGVK